MNDKPLSVIGTRCIEELFLESADEDYLVARWSALNRHLHQYLWSASQCLEKSLKALILLKRQSLDSTRGTNGHRLKPLLEKAHELYPFETLLDISPSISENLKKNLKEWDQKFIFTNAYDLISALETYGPPSSRYRNNSESKTSFTSVHSLDRAYFKIRNAANYPKHRQRPGPDFSLDQVRDLFPSIAIIDPPLGNSTIEALSHQNAEFFPGKFDSSRDLIKGLSFKRNSIPLHISNAKLFERPEELSDIKWVLNNAIFNKDDKANIDTIVTELVNYHQKNKNHP